MPRHVKCDPVDGVAWSATSRVSLSAMAACVGSKPRNAMTGCMNSSSSAVCVTVRCRAMASRPPRLPELSWSEHRFVVAMFVESNSVKSPCIGRRP